MNWNTVENIPACTGGAEQYRRNPDTGKMESRYLVVTSKINGVSNAAKIGNNIVMGSWIDPNFLVCPYDENAKWTTLEEPNGPTGIILFLIVVLGAQLTLFCYQWRNIEE